MSRGSIGGEGRGRGGEGRERTGDERARVSPLASAETRGGFRGAGGEQRVGDWVRGGSNVGVYLMSGETRAPCNVRAPGQLSLAFLARSAPTFAAGGWSRAHPRASMSRFSLHASAEESLSWKGAAIEWKFLSFGRRRGTQLERRRRTTKRERESERESRAVMLRNRQGGRTRACHTFNLCQSKNDANRRPPAHSSAPPAPPPPPPPPPPSPAA